MLGELKPKYVTIANFRKENKEAFKELFKAFNVICRDAGLFNKSTVAIDGSKFRAVNSKMTERCVSKIVTRSHDLVREPSKTLLGFNRN